MRKLKNTAVAIAAMLGASTQATMPATSVNADKSAQQTEQTQQKQTTRQIASKPVSRIVPNGYGGVDIDFGSYSRSPKEYGQYLQAIGKQKWNRKK